VPPRHPLGLDPVAFNDGRQRSRSLALRTCRHQPVARTTLYLRSLVRGQFFYLYLVEEVESNTMGAADVLADLVLAAGKHAEPSPDLDDARALLAAAGSSTSAR
jgi:hypothetical protein